MIYEIEQKMRELKEDQEELKLYSFNVSPIDNDLNVNAAPFK